MVKLIRMLSCFNPAKVLVVGDFMLDTYTIGKVKRISPEAPVSVLNVLKEESRPGGAGNVVLNLISLGAKVAAIGRVGEDAAGFHLRTSLQEEGVDIQGIATQSGFKTPVKNRFIADSQQILRVDFEKATALPSDLEEEMIGKLPLLLEDVQIVAVSDYGKGFLTRALLMALMALAKKRNIPVIVDPKGEDFSKYQGATIIKPNLAEAYAAAKLSQEAPLDRVARAILQNCHAELLLITRSEAGMSLFNRKGECFDFPVRSKEVKDVTGAGDTVLAMISLALANGLDIKYGAQIANIAAGMAIERSGCARISLSEMAVRLLEFDAENKIFDEEHLFALQQVLQGKRFTVLGLGSVHGMSTAVFKNIRKVAMRDKETKLIVYIYSQDPDEEFVSLLSSLSEVDFVVLKRESLKNLCDVIRPHEVFTIEGEELVLLEQPTALLERAWV